MKFRTRLVVYYLIATLVSMFFVGLAVIKGIERLSMNTVEQQLIGESKLAEIYISQISLLGSSDTGRLSVETAGRTITNLSLSLGNIRIYDSSFNLLAASEDSLKTAIPADENKNVLTKAAEGNYAYIVRDNAVCFASPLSAQGKITGILEIIHPLDFLNNLMVRVIRILMAGAAAFAVLLTLLSIYIAGRTTKPIRQLAAAANQYANRDFTPVDIRSSGETAQLCRSFNAMGSQLQEYIQRQKQFVSNVSHELRTPLTAIKGYSDYLADTDEIKDNPDLQRAIYHLNNESTRLAKLVDEVLTLSRIDSGKEEYIFEKLDFSRLVEETVEKMTLRAEKYGICIHTEIEHGINIHADPAKLIQVVVNLLDNAIRFSPAQSALQIHLYKQGDAVLLSIADQGIGIPEDEILKVFDRFYRAENARSIPGTGLGLAIVKDIVETHNGSAGLAANPGGGTTATLQLPVLP